MDRCKCEGPAGTGPFDTTYRVEIITRGTRERNIRADARDTRLDLLGSLRLDLSDVARARLLGVVAELVALRQISRATTRELRTLFVRPA